MNMLEHKAFHNFILHPSDVYDVFPGVLRCVVNVNISLMQFKQRSLNFLSLMILNYFFEPQESLNKIL